MTEQNGLGRSSATDVLRRLLDERGVEHYDGCENTLWGYEQTSESTGTYRYSADEISDGFVNVWLHHRTPEQAIAATLGPGTCHMVLREDICGHAYQDTYECSVCGEYVVRETYMGESEPPNYCPNCGRRCVG